MLESDQNPPTTLIFEMTELARLTRLYAGLTTPEACDRELKRLETEKQSIEEDYVYFEDIGTIGMLIGFSDDLNEISDRVMFVTRLKNQLESNNPSN